MTEELKKFILMVEEEETTIYNDGSTSILIRKRLESSLVGKLFSKGIVSIEVIRNVLKMAWEIENCLTIESLGRNLFPFHFQ